MANKTGCHTEAKSFLIVCFRYIGDVLVTTPLALSIKTAYPDACVDYLVFKGTEKAVLKNPYIRNTITIQKNKTGFMTLLGLFKKYDVAIAAYPSDRSVICTLIAGRVTVGVTHGRNNEWWKHLLLNKHHVSFDLLHVVSNMQALMHLLAIKPIPYVTMGYGEEDVTVARTALGDKNYILLHPYSMKRCKYWPAENWGGLAHLIHKHTNYTAVFTATPAPDDKIFLDEILSFSPVNTKTFPCSLNQFAAALHNCVAYIGIDTATTHIAAACEVPTIALYGPSLTRYWAPWPNGCMEHSPFSGNNGVQRISYVTVIQKDWECVPCNKEHCAISTRNKIECLEQITPEDVFREVMDNVTRTKAG